MIHRVTTDIKILQDGTKLSDKGTQKSPFIGAVGKDVLNISKYNIIVEKQVLATVPDFRKSLVGLIATYYTFNIQYPKEVMNTLLFIEKYLTGISSGPRVTPATLQTISAIDKLST